MAGLEPSEVVERLTAEGYNATREAVEALSRMPDADALLASLADEAVESAVLTREDIGIDSRARSDGERRGDTAAEDDVEAGSDDAVAPSDKTRGGQSKSTGRLKSRTTGDRQPREPEVRGDVTGRSTCTGELDDFVDLFRSRYRVLRDVLDGRLSPRTVASVTGGRATSLVGLVGDVRRTRSDNRLVELEDPTGSINVVLSGDDVGVADSLVRDEVIGVEGRASSDGGVVYADEVYLPDVPRDNEPSTADRDVEAVLVSDVHVGSDTFVEDLWSDFTSWLRDRDSVEYVLVGGDLVEGVGIYPGQDDELVTADLYSQYEECAERFRELPDDVEIVAITGNHDTVRLAEPQPALPEEFQKPFDSHVRFTGNPSTVSIEGVDVLMYHGVSLNPFAELLPDVSIESPETAMRHMLRKRHLAPMWGRVRLAPERQDYLAIDEIPDVLHTGHTHTVGADVYRGVRTVNTGAWQSQTDYQRAMNIQPDVGYAAVLDLSSLDLDFKRFR
ncbi:MAG: DNA-directed DNA polymerase II small subunit [Halobacteriales archaeon]